MRRQDNMLKTWPHILARRGSVPPRSHRPPQALCGLWRGRLACAKSPTPGTPVPPIHTGGTPVLPGFSLVELMIALGILGIGFAMAAALFPAALKQTELSYNDTIGTIIAQNGLAIARATLTMNDIPIGPNLDVVADDPNGTPTGKAKLTKDIRAYHDTTYPDKGFLVLGSKPTPGSNSCLLVIVAYAKKNPSAIVTAETITLNNIKDTTARVSSNLNVARRARGSPLILAGNGRYARIEEIKDEDLLLDHGQLNNFAGDAFVILEAGQAVSPAIAVLVARVALPQ